ncbi:MAG TPA: hypothetical protein VKS22_16240 [Candidatus Binataceae bacterium]|nr:hypothetical protein [Candidatus Binataceae bacterium]
MAITIQVHNISTVMTEAAVLPILAAVEAQIEQDVAPIWGNQTVRLELIAAGVNFAPGMWRFVIADTSDQAGAAKLDKAARAVQRLLDPVEFARHILQDDPWETQVAITRALERPQARVAVKGCHASSKTHLAAEFVLWFITRYADAIAVTTAPTARQAEDVMWGEIHKARSRSRAPYTKGNLTHLDMGTDGTPNYATGFTTNKGEQAVKFQGYHAPHLLFVLDEAPGIPPEILDAIEGAAAGGDVRVLMLGNPTIPSGSFYDAFTLGRANWQTFTIDAFDTPNFKPLREAAGGNKDTMLALLRDYPEEHPAIAFAERPYLATPLWARRRLVEWGERSPMWAARVRGQFPEQAEDSLLSLAWLEAARARGGG